jgi:hypothetical protein
LEILALASGLNHTARGIYGLFDERIGHHLFSRNRKEQGNMSEENHYAGIDHVIKLSTNISTVCKECDRSIDPDDFPESVNHYIQKHGYKLLHIGAETCTNVDGKPWNSTIAILGK